jgi:hypothetical protein
MTIESKNNDGVSNLDALDDVSLDNVHNPQEPKTTDSNTTGDAVKKEDQNPAPDKSKEDQPDPNKTTSQTDDNSNDGSDDTGTSNPIKSFDDLVNVLTTKTSDTLSDEENDQLSDLVDSFGGEALNKEGAIVDAEGKILYTSDQVKHFLTNDSLPVDDNGNFVNANGEIVKSKVELYRDTTTVGTVMNALAKNFNISYDDNYMPEDSEDSIVDLVNKVVKVVDSRSVENYMKSNPELDSLRKHIQLHGNADGFKANAVNFDNVDVKSLSSETKKAYITEAYRASGRTLTPAYSKYLDSLGEEDYNLEVSDNLKVLKANQETNRQQVDNDLKQKEITAENEAKQYWASVTNTVKNGKLANINIPLPEREGFLTYLTNPVQNGRSQDMLDADKDTVESDLLMSYLRYKGNDISALAKNIATTNSVQSLRERMQKNNRRNASSDKGIKPKTQDNYIPSLGDLNLR